jgi:2-polyprenyl-6-hydroxyphenyl methylase/3-demethylubiquinone-9 3-methyltransferase
MPLGTAVRRSLGRLEPAAVRTYREAFIDLDSLAVTIASVTRDAERVLEIGCGDGAMATALRQVLPAVELLGIDPGTSTPGRMFTGDRRGTEFRSLTTTELLASEPTPFDLVVLCDVLHHVEESARAQILREAASLTAPGGTVAIKEWERRGGLGTAMAYCADRWVSGDASVRFMPRSEIDDLVALAMPGWQRTCEARIPPRRANLLVTLRRPGLMH